MRGVETESGLGASLLCGSSAVRGRKQEGEDVKTGNFLEGAIVDWDPARSRRPITASALSQPNPSFPSSPLSCSLPLRTHYTQWHHGIGSQSVLRQPATPEEEPASLREQTHGAVRPPEERLIQPQLQRIREAERRVLPAAPTRRRGRPVRHPQWLAGAADRIRWKSCFQQA